MSQLEDIVAGYRVLAAHGIIDTVGMTLLYLGRTDLVIGAE